MDNEIKIIPGGELVETYWDYDEVAKIGTFKERNVTQDAPTLMFRNVSFHENLKLKDILLLLKRDILFYSIYLNNWVEEFVNEGLNNKPAQTFDDVEYLQLYWNLNQDVNDNNQSIIDGYGFPSFHMVSKKLIEDKYDEFGTLMYQANQRINYSLSFIPTNDLANIPIKLKRKLLICDSGDTSKSPIKFDDCVYSLGQVLYGIIWELSWYGSPEKRDKESDILNTLLLKDLKK